MPDNEERGREHSNYRRVSRSRSRSHGRSGRRRDHEKNKQDKDLHSHKRRRYSHSRSRSHSPRRSPSRVREHSRSRSPRGARKRSSRSRSRDRPKHKKRRSQSRPRSVSSSPSSVEERRREKRKEKHRKRNKSESRSRSRSRSRDRKERKRERREKKKHKKKDKGVSSSSHWGKYGIINESSLHDKDAEFRAWLVEERMVNPETMSKDVTKREFAKFIEDYNTATLPHEKYYNMDVYERRMNMLRNGDLLPPAEDTYDPNADLAAHSKSHKRPIEEKETYLNAEQLKELQRVQRERSQVGKMKLIGMDIKQNFGARMDGNEFEG